MRPNLNLNGDCNIAAFSCAFLLNVRECENVSLIAAKNCKINTYIVVRGTTNGATFAFDTLPPVLANRNDHVCSELQTSWMPYNKNVRTSWTTYLGTE